MSPRTVFGLTLLGVLLAGVPLLHLTGRTVAVEDSPSVAAPVAEAPEARVWLAVRCTGCPSEMSVSCAGKRIAAAQEMPDGLWEGEVSLPVAGRVELEVLVRWPEGRADGAQAVGVSLTPAGREEVSDTQWTFPGEDELHGMFVFSLEKP